MDEGDSEHHSNEKDNSNIEVPLELIESLFETTEHSPSPSESVYPEILLQKYTNVNRYYNYFQRNSRQFISDKQDGSIIRWSDSSIELLSKLIIESWLNVDYNRVEETNINQKSQNKTISPPTGLFSWSSGDSYIQARKKEIQNDNDHFEGSSNTIKESSNDTLEMKANESNFSNVRIITPDESIANKLNYIVDIESNKFIHARIQVIKAHHSEQMSRQIHERKRKDHEIMLKKLKLKEEESENLLRKATNEQSSKNNSFFGTLFGFGTVPSNTEDADSDTSNRTSLNKEGEQSTKKRFSFLPNGNMNLWGNSTSVANTDKIPEEQEETVGNADDQDKEIFEENDTSTESKETNDMEDRENEDETETVEDREIYDFNFIENKRKDSNSEKVSGSTPTSPKKKSDAYAFDGFEEFVSSVSTKNTTINTGHNFITVDTYTQPIPEVDKGNGELLDIFGDSHENEGNLKSKINDLLEL